MADRLGTLPVRVLGLRALAGEQPDQVVEAVPHLTGGIDTRKVQELGIGKSINHPFGLGDRAVHHRRQQPGSEVGQAQQTEQAEPAPFPLVQRTVAQLDARPDLQIAADQGCWVLKPRRISHTMWNTGPALARIIELYTRVDSSSSSTMAPPAPEERSRSAPRRADGTRPGGTAESHRRRPHQYGAFDLPLRGPGDQVEPISSA